LDAQLDREFGNMFDGDETDEKYPLESDTRRDLSTAHAELRVLEASLRDTQDRIAQINTRIANGQAEYELNMANLNRDVSARVGPSKLKRVGIPVVEREVGDEKAEAMPFKTKAELNQIKIENSAPEAFRKLQAYAQSIGLKINKPTKDKEIDNVKLDNVIKKILDKQSEPSKPASSASSSGRTLIREPSIGRPLREETPTVLVPRFDFGVDEFKDDGTEPPAVVEVVEEGRPSGRGRFGRFNSRSGHHKTLLRKMPFGYLDERNNIHKIMGKGIFTDVKNWFSDTFS